MGLRTSGRVASKPLASPPDLRIDCPICGLRIGLRLDTADPTQPICCPLGHPIPINAVPGIVEVIRWLHDIDQAIASS